jgi:hypothetical protein
MFRPCWLIFREKLSVVVTLSLHYTVERECAVDCALSRFWRRELFDEIDEKKLFVHLLVSNVFLYNIVHGHGTH